MLRYYQRLLLKLMKALSLQVAPVPEAIIMMIIPRSQAKLKF